MAAPWSWLGCLVVFVALGSSNHEMSEAVNQCDAALIKKIEQLWAANGTPTNIIQTIKKSNPECVYWTTDHYFSNQEDISCKYTIFADNGYHLNTYYKNSTIEGRFVHELEGEGFLYNPETGDKRIAIILNDRGVTTWYICNDEGSSGSAQCGILVSRAFSPDAVETAVQVLKDFGIEITFQLSLCCNPCYR